MISPNPCAKICLTRASRDIGVAVALLLAAACGGAVTNVGSEGSDGGGGDAGSDAGADATASDASASCATAVAGGACAIENESCSSGCTDPCSFCNILRCMGGTWVSLEAPPEPCSDASTTRRHPDARMSWQGPGGFAGTGPALIVDGSGSVRVWQSEHGFDPAAAPTAAPSATLALSGASVDALFDAWASTDTRALPHPGAGAECSAVVSVALCAHCVPTSLPYSTAAQLAPEMNAVWSWFDTNLPAMVTAAHPSNYCHF